MGPNSALIRADAKRAGGMGKAEDKCTFSLSQNINEVVFFFSCFPVTVYIALELLRKLEIPKLVSQYSVGSIESFFFFFFRYLICLFRFFFLLMILLFTIKYLPAK